MGDYEIRAPGGGTGSQITVDVLLRLMGDARVQAAIKGIAQGAIEATKELKAMASQSDTLQETTNRATSALEKHAAAGKKVSQAFKDVKGIYNDSGELIGKQEKIMVKYTDSLGIHTKVVGQATYAWNENATTMDKITSLWKSGFGPLDKLNKLLNTVRWTMVNFAFAAAAIAAVAAPFVLITKAGAELELQFKKISIVTGATTENIKNSLVALRQGTMFSLTEMADAYLEFTKQGFSSADAIKALPAITALATVGFTTLKDATQMVAQVLHQFNLEASQAAEVADILAKSANLSAADVTDFGIALSYAGPISEQAGYSLKETAAALSILSNRGLGASKAGTSYTAMVTSLIAPTEKSSKEVRALGVSFFDAQGEIKPLTNILNDLSIVLDKLPEKERLRILTDLFETRGERSAAALMQAAKEGEGTIADFTKKIDENGYAFQKMSEIQQTSIGQSKAVWEDFKTSFISATQEMNSVYSSFINGVKKSSLEGFIRTAQNITPGMPSMAEITGADKNAPKTFSELWSGKSIPTYTQQDYTLIQGVLKTWQEQQIIIKNIKNYLDAGLLQRSDVIEIQGYKYTVGEILEYVEDTSKYYDITENTLSNIGDKLTEIKDKADTAASGYQTSAESVNTIREQITDVNGEWYKAKGLTEEEFGLLSMIASESFVNILMNQEYWNSLTEEQREYLINIGKALKDVKKDQDEVRISAEAVKNVFEDIAEKYGNPEKNKYLIEMNTMLKDAWGYLDRITNAEGLGSKNINSITDWIAALQDGIPVMEGYISDLEYAEEQSKRWAAEIDRLQTRLAEQQETLKDYQASLSSVNEQIAQLSKPRFENQTAVERLMAAGEIYLKKQELASRGIGDAYAYIQQMLALGESGYEKVFTQVDNVNGAIHDSKTEFEAWQETVKQFIRSTVETSGELDANLSSDITRLQTLLLATSKYDEDSKTGGMSQTEETLRNLKDAYDVYYGEMNNDVQFSILAHQEEGQTIFNSSAQVVTALQAAWQEQAKWTQKVADAKSAVEQTQASIRAARTEYDLWRQKIMQVTASIEQLIAKLRIVASLKGGSGGGGGGTPNGMTEEEELELWNSPEWAPGIHTVQPPTNSQFTPHIPYTSAGDFVSRPNQGLIKIDPNDTLVGFKGNGPGTNVSIGNITINGINGDASSLAYELSKELKRQLRTM